MASNCTHTKELPGDYIQVYNEWTGDYETEWVPGDTVFTQEDIDLHRYRCTQCGEVGYYSSYGRSLYEKKPA